MLTEYYEAALIHLDYGGHDYNLEPKITEDNRILGYQIQVKELTPQLKEAGYYLNVISEDNGYVGLNQPSIPMSKELGHPSRKFGYTPKTKEELLEELK